MISNSTGCLTSIAKSAMNVEGNSIHLEEGIIAECVDRYFAADVAARKYQDRQWDLVVRADDLNSDLHDIH